MYDLSTLYLILAIASIIVFFIVYQFIPKPKRNL